MPETDTRTVGDPSGLRRRSVLKTAAWSVPVVAAAAAAPLAAASTVPTCPQCFDEGVLGGVTSVAEVLNNRGSLLLAGAFGLDSTGCDLSLFQPGYTSIVTSATLTMSSGATYVGTGLGSGTGTFGQIGALPGTFLFSNIEFPSGFYALDSNPVRPTRLSVSMNLILIGLPSLIEVTCPTTLTWNLNVWGAGAVGYTSRAGTITFSGTATDGTP